MAGQIHVPAQSLYDRVVPRNVGIGEALGGNRAPDQILFLSPQGVVAQPQRFVTFGQSVRAEDIHLQLTNQVTEQRAALFMFEIERDRFLSHIGGHEIAVTIGAAHGAADVAVGITSRLSAGDWRGFQPNDPPTEVDEAQRGVGHRQRLLGGEHHPGFSGGSIRGS